MPATKQTYISPKASFAQHPAVIEKDRLLAIGGLALIILAVSNLGFGFWGFLLSLFTLCLWSRTIIKSFTSGLKDGTEMAENLKTVESEWKITPLAEPGTLQYFQEQQENGQELLRALAAKQRVINNHIPQEHFVSLFLKVIGFMVAGLFAYVIAGIPGIIVVTVIAAGIVFAATKSYDLGMDEGIRNFEKAGLASRLSN